MQKQNVSAFTTIEILVVISVIAVLTVGVLTAVQRARVQSRNSEIKKVMSEMEGVQTTIKSERNTFAGYQPGVGFQDQRLQKIHQEIKDINGVGFKSVRLMKGKSDGWVIFTPTLGTLGGKSGGLCFSSETETPRRYNSYNKNEQYALAVKENGWQCPVNDISTLPGVGQNGLTYEWFKVTGYVVNNGAPTNTTEMNAAFNNSTSGVQFQSSGLRDKAVEWHSRTFLSSDEQIHGEAVWKYEQPSYISHDEIAWQVTGTLAVPVSGQYTFAVDGDDPVDLLIDGNVETSWYYAHCAGGRNDPYYPSVNPYPNCDPTVGNKPASSVTTISLQEGYYSIKARVVDKGGEAALAIGWDRPDDPVGIKTIPVEYFSPNTP